MKDILQNTIIDLQLAGYSPRTVEAYSYHVKKFLEYFDKDPRSISEDEIKQYFLYLKYKKKLSGSANELENDQQLPKVLLCPICGSPLQWVEKLQKGLHRAVSKGFKDHVP